MNTEKKAAKLNTRNLPKRFMGKLKPSLLVLLFVFSALITQQSASQTLKLSFVGDILLDRGVSEQMKGQGVDYPFLRLGRAFSKSDIVYGNLECPLAKGGIPSLKDPKYIFKAPPQTAGNLKKAGFNFLNLANNHTMDYGSEGLIETMNALDGQDISYSGGGMNKNAASEPVFLKVKGVTFGFLSFSVFPAEGFFYTNDKPNISTLDIQSLASNVSNAKELCDFLIVSFHWGREFDFFPSSDQKNAAHMAIDSGADLIIGHHPHVFQGVEKYKDKFIFYSLGNFIFDRQIPEGTDQTVILNLYMDGTRIDKYELLPVKITGCQPEVLSGADGSTLLSKLLKYSEIKPEIAKSKGYITPE